MPHRDPITRALSAIDPRDAPALALLGHDLRATVSEVIGGLRLIDSSALPDEPRQQIARTRAAAEAMALLLEQALMLLLGDDPAYPIPKSAQQTPALQTDELLEKIRLRWSALAQMQGLNFTLNAGQNLPAQLALDPVLLERLLSNLLGNAIKYAGQGRITCILDLTAKQNLRLCVQDQGPGFTNLDAVFLGQTRPHNPEKPGSGLGLQMVKDMVERAGGQITARNRTPNGAEVIVTLPLVKTSQIAPSQIDPLPDLHGLRILVADDSETSRLVLHALLTSMGAKVDTVPDGFQAVERIKADRFDALLIDVEMPNFNGLKVIRHIRKLPQPTAAMPILAVTAYQLRANKQAILAVGADDILSKPIAGAAVLGNVILRSMQDKAQIGAGLHSAALAQVDLATFDGLLKMAGPKVAAELLTRMLADLQATERALLAASHAPNWPAIRAQTHILIALAGTAGAPRLHHLAQAINDLAHQPAPDINTFRTLLPQVLESLDMLIHFIGQKSPHSEESA